MLPDPTGRTTLSLRWGKVVFTLIPFILLALSGVEGFRLFRPFHLFRLFCLFCPFFLCSLSCKDNAQSSDNGDPKIISVSQTIVILVQDSINLLHPEKLNIHRGVEDEQPEGPTSFDVLQNNSGFVITDPLRERVVFYDSSGNYLKYADTGFPVSGIKTMNDHSWLIQSATSNERKMLEQVNQPNLNFYQATSTTNDFEDATTGAILHSDHNAVVWRSINNKIDSIQITYTGEENLVSVQYIGKDQANNTAVSLETAVPADSIAANVMVRIYNVEDQNVSQVNDIDENMLVYPIDQFRYHDGKLYQLVVLQDKVLIKIWNVL